MPSSERPEKSGNLPPQPKSDNFADLLDWHLSFGTRPAGSPDRVGKRWGNGEFGGAVGGVDERTVRNWRKARSRPYDLGSIERALFGENAAFDEWQRELRAAYDRNKPSPDPPPPPPERPSIPRPPTHFLGRDDALADLLALIDAESGTALLLQGGPGHGKTALTLALGNHPRIVARFGAARWFVALETATTDAALRDALARAVGADPAGGFGAVRARLAAQPALLILDNLETPWEPAPERRAVEDTLAELAAIPGLALLASFRGREPVGGPAWAVRFVEHLAPPHDTALFLKHAHGIRSDDPDLAPLVGALGGIPLAIELVAAQAYGLDRLGPLRRRWDAVGVELAAHRDYEPGRLTSLPHSIELSLRSERLREPGRRLFRLLGRLPAGLCEEDRDALLGADGFAAEAQLRSVGLAVTRAGRLDLLPPVRDYAGRHHPPEPADEAAWPAYYLAVTKERGEAIGTRAGEGAIARLLPEFPNIQTAIRALLAAGRRSGVMVCLEGLYRLAYIGSLQTPVFKDLAEACQADGDLLGEASCIKSLGDIAFARYEHISASAAYEQAKLLYRKIGDLLGEGNCIKSLGNVALRRSDHELARIAFEKATPLYRQFGDLNGEANCIKSLGDIALYCANQEKAHAAYTQAKILYKNVGNLLGEANCTSSLADLALNRGDHNAAAAAYEQAKSIFQLVGDLQGEAMCIARIGDIALHRSDFEAGRNAYEQAIPLFRQVGDLNGESNCIVGVANIGLLRSDHETARLAFEQARPIYQSANDLFGEAGCAFGLGIIAQARLDFAAARDAYEEARTLYRRCGNETWEAEAARRLVALYDTSLSTDNSGAA